jgi:hypothetical protein
MAVQRRPDGTTRGGNEPPDEVQDTPKQNAGYDAAVRGETSAEVVDEENDDEAARPVEGEADEAKPRPAIRRRRSASH